MDITILIINWNSGDCLGRLLSSLGDVSEIISGVKVLDNGSRDQSAECITYFPQVEFERLKENTGFAAAVNYGFRTTGSSYLLLVNPDIEFESARDTVADLHRTAVRHGRAAIVTCPLRDLPSKGGKLQSEFQFRPYPTFWNTLSDLLFIDEILRLFGRKHGEAPNGRELEPGVMELSGQPAAALWLVRRSAWEETGGMDERFYPAWFEDVDFCLGVKKQGWKILFTKGSGKGKVFHKGGSSLDTLGFSGFLGLYYRNLLRFWWKHHPVSLPLVAVAAGVGYVVRRACQFTNSD